MGYARRSYSPLNQINTKTVKRLVPEFDCTQLADMKKTCERHCYSTLNLIVGDGYRDRRLIHWMIKQVRNGFQGVRGIFV